MENTNQVSIHIPSQGNRPGGSLTFPLDDFQTWLKSVNEYAGEQFESGNETDQTIYRELLEACGVEVATA